MKAMLSALCAVSFVAFPAAAQTAQTFPGLGAPASTSPVTLPASTPAVVPIAAPTTTSAVLRAGTPIQLQMMEEVTTKKKAARVGQRFMMEVTAPVEVNGVVVIPAGTPAWGEIVSVRNKGMWGKSGHLDAKVLFARVNGRQIRLTGSFDDKGKTGTAGVIGAVALLPVAGFFLSGTSAVLPKSHPVGAFIDEDVPLAMANMEQAPMQVGGSTAVTPVAVSVTPGQ